MPTLQINSQSYVSDAPPDSELAGGGHVALIGLDCLLDGLPFQFG